MGHQQNGVDPDQTPLNAASDQVVQRRLIRFCTVCLQNALLKFDWNRNLLPNKSKKDSKDQESIQLSSTPVPGHQMGK